jgi:hypothetical protein
MAASGAPASYAKIQGATKIRILFFSQSTVGYSGRRKPQSEKRQLTLDVLRKKSINPSPLF